MPAWSELEGAGGATTRLEVEQPLVSHEILVVDIPFDGEEDIGVEPQAIPLSWELVMIRSLHDTAMARSSSGLGVTRKLVWPCPSDPWKAQFVLCDG